MKSNSKSGAASTLKKIVSIKEFTVIAITVILIVFASFASTSFLSSANIKATAIGVCINGIVAIAMAICLISGNFDLSVGSILGLSSIVCVLAANSGMNIWVAAVVGIIVGGVCGLINGILIGYVGLNGFIITLAMMQMARGLVNVLTNGGSVGLNDGTGVDAFRVLGSGSIGEIPVIVIIFLICIIVSDILIRKLGVARNLFFVGSNRKTAALSGINVKFVTCLVFTLSGIICGFAGILNASRFGMATQSTGNGIEMTIISGAVVGGVSMAGGKGSVIGAALGIVMMTIISNILVILNVSIHWQDFITGLLLVMAVAFDFFSNKRSS